MSSALTSTPSAPSSPFHIPSRQYSYSRSPRASPRLYAASPKRGPRTATPTAATSAPRQPKEQQLAGSEPAVGGASKGYVDAGTQYSPDGFPPTAGRNVAVSTASQLQPPGSAGSAKKRKESGRSESPSRQQMSGAYEPARSSTWAAATPGEPDARRDPSAVATPEASSSARPASSTAGLPQRAAAPQDPEPEEARSTHGHSSAPKRSRPDPATVKQMPRQYWTCNPKDLGVLISNMLMELIRLNDRIPLRDGRLTRFHSRAPPGISVQDYLQRLIQHATLSPPILLSMVYYIDRLCALYSAFTINSLTVHRFLITAATVAAKGLSDSFWTNPTYARIGGIPVTELATLELEFLQKVQWKIVPKPENLEDYYRSLVDRTEGYELEPGSSGSSSIDESEGSGGSADGDAGEDAQMVDKPA
ncbi:Pho80p cyclin [Recurvomyces mirabilis]|nr:Pho80p cyclin [Recurvomyces mirabilis]